MTLLSRSLCCCAALCLLASLAANAQSLSFRDILNRADLPKDALRINYGPGPQQFGELSLPKGDGPHPVVVLIHGGCWQAALPGPELVAHLADALRKEGLAVWSISYRRVGHAGGGYPGTFEDIATGVDHLRKIAEPFKLDLNRVVATGHSAGGHLAHWAAARPKLPEGSALRTANPLPLHAVVPLAGMPDLAYASSASAHACGDKTVAQLVNLDVRGKTAFADTSVVELLPVGVRQIMVSGTYDGIVAPAQAWRFVARARDKGEAVALQTLENAGHFELIAPWTAPGRRVVEIIRDAVPR